MGSPRPPVITYECVDASYEKFGTVFRILCRMHVHASELVERTSTLAFFLPAMKMEDLLVDLATAPPDAAPQLESALQPGRRIVIHTPPKEQGPPVGGVVCGAHVEDGDRYPVLPDGSKEAVLLPHATLEAQFDPLACSASGLCSRSKAATCSMASAMSRCVARSTYCA